MDLTDKTWEEIITNIVTVLLERGLVGWFILIGCLSFFLGFGIMLLRYKKAQKRYEEELSSANQNLKDCEKKLSTAKTDLAFSQNTLLQTQQSLTTCQRDLSEITQKFEDCKITLSTTQQKLDVSEKSNLNLKQVLDEREEEISTLKHFESYLYIDSAYKNGISELSDPALDSFTKPDEPVHT